MKNDPYFLHKLALSPLLSKSPKEELQTIAKQIHEIGEDTFLKFLAHNMLTPLWNESLAKHDALSFFSKDFTDKLKKASLIATGRFMKQQHSLNQATEILDSESIPYAVFKGAHIREVIYSNPAVRASDDIDILISKSNREKSIQSLVKAGYLLQADPKNISHEITLSDPNVKLDLHWDILRPGRTRINLVDELIASQERLSNFCVLGKEAELFIMLVHPVITKYLTTPHASLNRVVDLLKWIQMQDIDWDKVYIWLDKSGLKTAAWINAYWLKLLTEKTLPTTFVERIRPSSIKGSYLKNWINKNYSTRFLNNPLLIKTCFTLPIHDKFSDALFAIKSLRREKGIANSEIEKLKQLLASK